MAITKARAFALEEELNHLMELEAAGEEVSAYEVLMLETRLDESLAAEPVDVAF